MTLESDLFSNLNNKATLLIGAGASKPLGMPLMREFHDLVVNKLDNTQKDLMHNISLVHMKKTQEVTPDLEALLAIIEKYRNFHDILFGDERFGYSVDQVEQDIEELNEKNRNLIDRQEPDSYLIEAYYQKQNIERLDTLLRDLMFEEYGKSLDGSKLEQLYSPLFETIGVHYPQDCIPIFTTNYDMAIETYTQQSNIHLETGFESTHTGNIWKPGRYYQFRPVEGKLNMLLFKLHGSLTYHRKDNNIISTGLPLRDPLGYKSAVIYPTQTKDFPDEEPFRTNYGFLRGCLSITKLAIVIGYSFRDPGIHRILNDIMELNQNLRFILICGPKEEHWKKFAQQNLRNYHIIPHYFDSASDGSPYLDELAKALA